MTESLIDTWKDPHIHEIGDSVQEFLTILKGPTLIHLTGRDSSRVRAISTLLHGNEPSGLHAVFQLLQTGFQPAFDLVIFIGSVQAAMEPPGFAHRHLPGRRDLNRCFRPPFDDYEGKIAEELICRLETFQAEYLVDVHNTSGKGPSFGVAILDDPLHNALVACFTQRLIITDLRLGALMELSETHFPTVTVECGSASDPMAHSVALQGIMRYANIKNFKESAHWSGEILTNPVRLELKEHATICYSDAPLPGIDLTLPLDVEHYNFEIFKKDAPIGWLGGLGLDALQVKDSHQNNIIQDYFENYQGQLVPRKTLRPFMITQNAQIAKSDCVCYLVITEDSSFDTISPKYGIPDNYLG